MSSEPTASPAIRPILRLYVAGDTAGARRALRSRARLIAATTGAVDIEVINILEQPAVAEREGIMATPTLSDDSVVPPRRLIGDISNITQVLEYFGYSEKDDNR